MCFTKNNEYGSPRPELSDGSKKQTSFANDVFTPYDGISQQTICVHYTREKSNFFLFLKTIVFIIVYYVKSTRSRATVPRCGIFDVFQTVCPRDHVNDK